MYTILKEHSGLDSSRTVTCFYRCYFHIVERSRDRFPVVSLGIFSLVPPTEPCALRSTQPLKVSTTDFSWGKGGRCVWLTTYHPSSAETSRKSGALIYLEPLGPPRPVAGDLYFTYFHIKIFCNFLISNFRSEYCMLSSG